MNTGIHDCGNLSHAAETFKKGDVLIAIDPRDYDLAITHAKAQVAEARHRLALEEAESVQVRHEWKTLGGKHPPTPLMLRLKR